MYAIRSYYALGVGAQLRLAGLGAFDAGVSHLLREQPQGTNGVVVAGDDVVDLVRVAVGVDNGDNRDTEFAGFLNGVRLFLRIDDEVIALKASGVSLWQMLKPALWLAVTISVITAALSLSVVPASNSYNFV